MRYYSILRPISIGTYPNPKDNEVLKINNFDSRSYCKDIDREAWGFIDYEKSLSLEDSEKYELVEKLKINKIDMRGEIEEVNQKIASQAIYFMEQQEFETMEEKARKYDIIAGIASE